MKKLLVTLFIIISVVALSTSFDEVISAIDSWLSSIPEKQYKEAEGQELFAWKLRIEKLNEVDYMEKFPVYGEIIADIKDLSFTYNKYLWSEKAARFRQIAYYDNYFYNHASGESTELSIMPSEYLSQLFEYIQNNMNDKDELWLWLDYILKEFLSYSWHSGKDEFYGDIVLNARSYVEQILKLYLVTSKELLEQPTGLFRTSPIINYDNYYSTYTVFASTQSPEEVVLSTLSMFSKYWKEYLTTEEKEMILNFVIPKYLDLDESVKIYKYLNKDGD